MTDNQKRFRLDVNSRAIQERDLLSSFLLSNPALHLYALGDLDPRYWPYTRWFGAFHAGHLSAVSFLYTRFELPVFQALCDDEGNAVMARHLRQTLPFLPRDFYAHLSPGLELELADGWQLTPHGQHDKMFLMRPERLEGHPDADVVRLTPRDLPALHRLYNESYPDNAFDGQTIDTGLYYGIWHGEELVCAAGVHVAAPTRGVAALGNIATLPPYRGQGMATRVTARLCRRLRAEFRHIGLNVKSSNHPARACYRRLGFEERATYYEWTCRAMRPAGELFL